MDKTNEESFFPIDIEEELKDWGNLEEVLTELALPSHGAPSSTLRHHQQCQIFHYTPCALKLLTSKWRKRIRSSWRKRGQMKLNAEHFKIKKQTKE